MGNNVYQIITDRIIAELEKGVIPWRKPWTGTQTGAYSHSTGKPYSLLNQMLLGRPGEYITWSQVKAEGGIVRQGEKSSVVVFWKQQNVKELDAESGEEVEKSFLSYDTSMCSTLTSAKESGRSTQNGPRRPLSRLNTRRGYRLPMWVGRACESPMWPETGRVILQLQTV